MKRKTSVSYLGWVSMLIAPVISAPSQAQEVGAGRNIALGQKVEAFPRANSSDTGNSLHFLTDGKSEGTDSMWVRANSYGWRMTSPACLVVDLGSVQPIAGFSYHTAAGVADVTWPTQIFMAVSDDNKNWRYAGDLVELSAKHSTPPAYGAYNEYSFSTRELKLKGRYVAFGILSPLYTTTDELEVYAGNQAWLAQPDNTITLANQPQDVLEYMRALSVKQKQSNRIKTDAGLVRASIAKSKLAAARKAALQAKLAEAEKLAETQPVPGPGFKAIAPVGEAHRQVLAVHGELLAAEGLSPLTVWSQHRYAWLPLVGKPATGKKADLAFAMLRNQFRSQALLLTNATAAPQTVKLKLNGGPKGAKAGWLKIDEVSWTDTQQNVVVADALLPVTGKNGEYSINVPAGMTRKVWVTIDSSKLRAGSYKSNFLVQGGGIKATVPLQMNVAKLAMKRPRISLGMWDDADSADIGGGIGITMKNREAALKLMRSHYVDTAWGKRTSLPWPEAKDFDAAGNLIGQLDFTRFDRWIALWPEARRFYNFLYLKDEPFAGANMGTAQFDKRVGAWAREVSRHMVKLGLQPNQLGLLLVDEPHFDSQDAIIAAWAKAINASAPELTLFSDPVWARPDQTKIQEAITSMDVLAPVLPLYKQGGKPVADYFENLRRQGKELWLYQCTGPIRLFDPQLYYRYQAWHVYSIGGTGQGFWSFGDTGGTPTSWNDYSNAPYFSYTPAFIDIDTVNNSVHWDAVREGMEDFEELAMLRDAIAASKDVKLRAEAQKVHDNAVKAITSLWKDAQPGVDRFFVNEHYDWAGNKIDPEVADKQLSKVRAMLLRLS